MLIDGIAPAGVIDDPLDHLRAEHERQRAVCDRLEHLLESMEVAALQPEAKGILDFLEVDLRHHIADEERDLFPRLAERARPEDKLRPLLRQLSREHEMDEDLVDFLRADLQVLARGRDLANPTRLLINLREFAVTQRRHLDWEDETVLPLAEARLTPEDRHAMAESMRRRRA
jgi:hemerythrin-like domain-containing protein